MLVVFLFAVLCGSSLLPVVRCLFCVACGRVLFGVCCFFGVVCRLLFVVRCLLLVVRCLLFVVLRSCFD